MAPYLLLRSWVLAFSWLLVSWAALKVVRQQPARHESSGQGEWALPLVLAGVIGVGVIALTCLFDAGSFSFLAANRFLVNMPGDNQIPGLFADRLWSGQSRGQVMADWLSSDRPPLQTGWLLLTKPILTQIGFDSDTSSGGGGVCFPVRLNPRTMGAGCVGWECGRGKRPP